MKRIIALIICAALLFSMVSVYAEETGWQCPQCGTVNSGNYCTECGSKKPEAVICPNCGEQYPADTSFKFCANCGASLPSAAASEAMLVPYKTVGSAVTFGSYEQDNDTSNGPEEIEWIVLDVQDGKSLLLSKYGLDAKPYNTESTSITWENSTIRKWLNNDFITAAFTADEQKAIIMTQVDNSSAQGYSEWSTSGGNNTQDQIFLLSYAEAKKYLDVEFGNSSNLKARVSPTAYAEAQGADTSSRNETEDGEAAGWWWLRSPGPHQRDAAFVLFDGSLNFNFVNIDRGCVRPAFWINLESDIF